MVRTKDSNTRQHVDERVVMSRCVSSAVSAGGGVTANGFRQTKCCSMDCQPASVGPSFTSVDQEELPSRQALRLPPRPWAARMNSSRLCSRTCSRRQRFTRRTGGSLSLAEQTKRPKPTFIPTQHGCDDVVNLPLLTVRFPTSAEISYASRKSSRHHQHFR